MARISIFLMIAALSAVSCVARANGATPEGDHVLRHFATGTGTETVGAAASEGSEDREEDGPQALTSDSDGKLYLLDQMNQRILAFKPGDASAPNQTLSIPSDVQPTDLVVKGDTIYVWDGKVHEFAALGASNAPTRGLAETRSVGDVDDFTATAFTQMGSATVEDETDQLGPTRGVPKRKHEAPFTRQFVDTAGRGPVVVDVTIVDGGAGARLAIQPKPGKAVDPMLSAPTPIPPIHLRVPDKLGTVAFLGIDKTDHMYVLAEDVPRNIDTAAFAFVARFGPAGALEGLYEMPLGQTTSISRRSVTVSPDGDVYFLKAMKKSVDIIGIGFRATPNASVVTSAKSRVNYAALAWSNTQWVGMAVGPLTRQRILQSAYGYEGFRWNLAPGNYGPQNDKQCSGFNGRIRRPMYMIGKENQTIQSVPYCWGCQGSLAQFAARVQHGALAGNVCTKDGIRPDAVGVDCSSFVSATWGLSTHFTTAAIPAIASRISNPWDLQPGDALDKPGSHVVLFLGFTADRQARVMEASPGACKGRVCRNTYPLSSLLARGFVPVRYRALVSEQAVAKGAAVSIAQ